MPKALIQGRIAVPKHQKLRDRMGEDWQIVTWHPDEQPVEEYLTMLEDADVVIGGAPAVQPWPAVPNLKLYQIPWTGFEFTSPDRMPKGIPLCNVYEHESAIAEYAMLGMLEWRIGLRHMDARFRAKGWDGRDPGAGDVHGEVRGNTVGIVGYGHIGHEVAVRARAFGMNVVGIRRSTPPCPPELDWLGTIDRLEELLSVSDFVIVACDLNKETRGLIDADRIAKMKPTGVIINVARGKVIDEQALYDALRDRRIGGAVIDVWYNYNEPGKPDVWPTSFPFQVLDNVICSAHECGWTEEQIDRRWDVVAQNLRRVVHGEAPVNQVFVGTQET